ncbi:MAG: YdcF family protein [Chloroflexi bacterium]|nr:YdcF family protein [Chloroflexota bacterium]
MGALRARHRSCGHSRCPELLGACVCGIWAAIDLWRTRRSAAAGGAGNFPIAAAWKLTWSQLTPSEASGKNRGINPIAQTGKAPLLILTGGWLPWRPADRPAGEVLAASAVARGIPGDRVRVTGRVLNTAAEAQAVAQLLHDEDPAAAGPVILVTSAFHMRRSAWLFRQAGVDVFPYPVDFRVPEGRAFTILHLLPAAEGLKKTELALREWYGYLYYRLRG